MTGIASAMIETGTGSAMTEIESAMTESESVMIENESENERVMIETESAMTGTETWRALMVRVKSVQSTRYEHKS